MPLGPQWTTTLGRIALGAILLGALGLTACTPGRSTHPTSTSSGAAPSDLPPDGETPAPTQTTEALPPVRVTDLRGVTVQAWHAFAGPAYELFASQAAQFNAFNEWGIIVAPTAYRDYPELFEAVQGALGSGAPPDLVAALPEHALAWDALDGVVDLNPYISDPGWGLAPEALADIPSAFLAQDSLAGRQLGVPAQRSTRLIFYNETWAHELGFSAPPQTPDQFRQQACAANAAFRTDLNIHNDGYGGWAVDTDWLTAYSWLLAFGGQVQDGTAFQFRTDQNLEALGFLKGLYDDACAWLSTEPNPFEAFAGRRALFVTGDLAQVPYAAGAMARAANADSWTVLPFPGVDEGRIVVYGPSYVVLRSTPERQLAAWLFARWLLATEIQAQWVEATDLLPLRTSLLEMIGPYQAASPQWVAAVADLPMGRGVPQLAAWRRVRYLLEDGLTVVFRMDVSADQLASILAEMDAMADELDD
jgi:ABC-type glycerol-3-phosphate transport system substrate-binding protein